MANFKITDLTNYTNPDAANDVIEIVNVGSNTNQKITRNNLLGITSTPVGINDTQVLTAKTLTAPTINSPILGGTITGTYTLAGTPTFPSSVVTLTGSQTLTNKVLTSPTINAPTITNASLTADAITGFTTANTGTIYGVPVSAGLITGSSVTNIPATSLGTGAITLGYAQIVADFSTTSATAAQITGLTATVTIPVGSRRIEITAWSRSLQHSIASGVAAMSIWDGVVGSGTQLAEAYITAPVASGIMQCMVVAIVTPPAGSKTYNIGLLTGSGGTATNRAGATFPSFILVKAI